MDENHIDDELIEEIDDGGEEFLGGPDLFGNSPAGPLYQCSNPEHGKILARNVVWRRDGTPHCPLCDAELTLLA